MRGNIDRHCAGSAGSGLERHLLCLIGAGGVEYGLHLAVGRPTAMNMLLLVLDLIGTFVFALSGATAAVKRRLDLFGVLVLSFVAGNFGGITRDLMIGAVPPAAISDWRYLAASFWRACSPFAGFLASTGGATPCSCSTLRDWRCSPCPAPKRRWPSA